MRCEKCKKLLRENTVGQKKYCQGHSFFSDMKLDPCLEDGKTVVHTHE